ncbi:ribosomal protein L16 [Neorickettsia helminthoeca str. Oregon]|uniref:Large ribosomal subunit protein uL16 n=1 Tax=Neorickettsia helminthoeca str. Oregon TaxID=1286528 RepID=X5GVW4_9RICK|nr:50S ribosomal protein L16 [Neorickettsia helminthoeca]AHX11217.1 ribosomal protein L16 [Neorickettsia helminthoeca str. Oregon]
MFAPKKVKHKKFRKVRFSPASSRGSGLAFGDFGLKAVGSARLNGKQIESARRVITRIISRAGKLWINVFPGIPLTRKPTDVRMGGGKGSVDSYIFPVSPGRVLFELSGVDKTVARLALCKASAKLPFSTKFIERAVVDL